MTTGTILWWDVESFRSVVGIDGYHQMYLLVDAPVGMVNAAEALTLRAGDQVALGPHWRTGQTCILGQIWSPA